MRSIGLILSNGVHEKNNAQRNRNNYKIIFKLNLKHLIVIIPLLFCFDKLPAQDTLPPLNRAILNYIENVIGKKVDRGECWDLANQALTRVNAKWDHHFKYGKLLDPKKDVVYPGDIIQFFNVETEKIDTTAEGITTSRETMGQHTAIIYRVNAPGDYQLAHQNTSFSGRKVGVSRFVLKYVKKGKLYIYRPTTE